MGERVLFASSEREFIHNFGVNNGFTESYSKVNRCYFISSEAKQLYYNIKEYAYHGKRDCFPGTDTLRAELGWSKERLSKYLKELNDVGLVTSKKRFGKTTVYTIEELHSITALVHSELVHEIRTIYYKGKSEDFCKALTHYKKSELFDEVTKAENPIEYKEKIAKWFIEFTYSDEEEEVVEEEPKVETEEQPKEEDVEEQPKPIGVPLPKLFKVGDLNREEDSKKPKKKSPDPNKVPVEEWNTNHFAKYFEQQYYAKMKVPYLTTKEDRGALARVVKNKGNNEVLKQHMDNFIELDFFETKTLRIFSSNHSQSILDNYLNSGKLPSYRVNKGEDKHQASSDWDSQLEGIFE